MATVLEFDPIDPALAADPHPLYHRMREQSPVHRDDRTNAWYLTRHADVVAALRDPSLSSERPHSRRAGQMMSMVGVDPPDHTRLRRLVSKAFTPRMVEQLRPRVESIAAALLDRVAGRPAIDLVQEFAYPLPITVIAEMLGVPEEDRAQFRGWFEALFGRDEGRRRFRTDLTAEEEEELTRPFREHNAAMRELISRRRRQPGDDLISELIAVEEQGDSLSEDELVAMCTLLVLAGHVTTVSLISGGMLALFQNPNQLDRLRREPVIVETAVEELLRYTAPVVMVQRVAREDVEVGGRTVRAGQIVMPLLAAANRDPSVFPDPDRLDLCRDPNPHIAFAHGIHFCLGAPLTRLEAQVAFPMLLERFPALRPAGDAVYWPSSMGLRGLRQLPVALA